MHGVKAWHACSRLMMHICRFSQHRAKHMCNRLPALPHSSHCRELGSPLGPHHQVWWLAWICLRMSLTDEHTSQWGNCHLRVYLEDVTNQTLTQRSASVPVSGYPVLGLQMHATMLGFFHRFWGSELIPLCLHYKHFPSSCLCRPQALLCLGLGLHM